VPGANLEWIEVENESGPEVDLDIRVDGQSVDFDLEA
jgi:hypothetical protein